MIEHYSGRDKMLLQVDVTELQRVPFQYKLELPQDLAAHKPLIIAQDKTGNHWKMNSLDLVTNLGILIRFTHYQIEAEQELCYNLSEAAVCIRFQYQGQNSFRVTSKQNIKLMEGQYNILALRSIGEKMIFEKGSYDIVEIYVAASRMDFLKPYFHNFWALERKQKITKMAGKSAYHGWHTIDTQQIVDYLWGYFQSDEIPQNSFYIYPLTHLVALALKEQKETHQKAIEANTFPFITKWKDLLIIKGSEKAVDSITEGAISGSNTILIKGNAGWILLQTTPSHSIPIWNIVASLDYPCSVHIHPNCLHYSFTYLLHNQLSLYLGTGEEIQISEGCGRFFRVSPFFNTLQWQSGITRSVHLYVEEPCINRRLNKMISVPDKYRISKQITLLENLSILNIKEILKETDGMRFLRESFEKLKNGKVDFDILIDMIINMPKN
jgi:hypothetical protein